MTDYNLYDGITEAGLAAAAAFDIAALDRDFYENPYPVFHALRRHAPVHRLPNGAWFLTRHADLDLAYHDPALFSSDKTVDFKKTMGDTSLYEHHTTSPSSMTRRATRGCASVSHRPLRRGHYAR